MWKMIVHYWNICILLIIVFCASGQNLFNSQEEILKNKQFQNLVGQIMEEMRFQNKCMVFISDSYYKSVLNFDDIQAVQYFPIYQIFIKDNEVVSLHRRKIKTVLLESRKNGCNSYVILMNNGLQVMKLMQYVERERLIDTRGYFLFMHDYRILRAEMRYMWNKILNVIFLHKYTKFYHKSGTLTSREWFSLETVYYPVEAFKFVITESIDKWYNGRFLHGGYHFKVKTADLKNEEIQIAVFEHFPAVTANAINKYENEDFTKEHTSLGIEFELILYIAKAINFRPMFYKPSEIEINKWGTEMNGSYNGLIGEAVAGKATFYLGDFYNTLQHHRLLDLSRPYNTECLTFLTPELLSDTSWKLLISPFRFLTWITVIFTLIMGSGIVYFFSRFYKHYISLNKSIYLSTVCQQSSKNMMKIIESKDAEIQKTLKEENEGLYLFTEVQNSMLYIYSMILQVSLPLLPRAWAVRVFIGCWWIYSILIAVAYRASMTATLANPIEKKTINTVMELTKSSIKIGSWIQETRNILQMSDDPNVQKLATRFELVDNETEGIERVANGVFAYYENIYFLQQTRVMRQVMEGEKQDNATKRNQQIVVDRNLHVMKECLIYMPISLGMNKNSALKHQVDQLIVQAIESGLVEKWLSDVMEWSKIAEKKFETEPPKAMVNFQKLHGALVALGIGYFLGLISLIGEILHWKYVVLKDPAYDKYKLDEYYKRKK